MPLRALTLSYRGSGVENRKAMEGWEIGFSSRLQVGASGVFWNLCRWNVAVLWGVLGLGRGCKYCHTGKFCVILEMEFNVLRDGTSRSLSTGRGD